MSRYFDKNGKEVVCSREDYIAEMDKRQEAVSKAAAKPKAKPKKKGDK